MSRIHVAVVGAGVIGLAVAYHLLQEGTQVTVIDRDPDGDRASFGNAGGRSHARFRPGNSLASPRLDVRPAGSARRASGACAQTHSLACALAKASTPHEITRISQALAAINTRVYGDLLPLLHATGLTDQLRRNGALSLYETEPGYRRDATEWACKRSHGIEAQVLTGDEARQLEPALGPLVQRAVLTPQWSYVSDPKRLVQCLKVWLIGRGVVFRQGEVHHIASSTNSSPSPTCPSKPP